MAIRLRLGGKVVDDDAVFVVPEADVFEGDVAPDFFGSEVGGFAALVGKLRLFQKLEHPLGRGGGRLHARERLRQLRQRRSEQPDVQGKGDDRAVPRHRAVDEQHRTDNAHRNVPEVADECHKRLHQAGKELRFPRARVQFIVDVVERLLDVPLRIVRLDYVMPRIRFFDVAVDFAQVLLLAGKVLLRLAHDEEHEHESDEACGDRRERHDPVCDEHHDDAADEHDHRRDEGRDRLVEGLTDHVHVVGDAREHVADGVGIEVFEGQEVDLFGDLGAQRPGIFLRDRRHDQPLHIRTDKTQSVDYDEEHAQAEHFLHIHAEDLVDAVIGQVQERRLNGVRQVAENVRADEVEYRTRDREHERDDDGNEERPDEQDELAHRLFEVLRFFRHARAGAVRAAADGRTILFFTHASHLPSNFPVLPRKAANRRSRGRPRTTASIRRACLCRPPCPRRGR